MGKSIYAKILLICVINVLKTHSLKTFTHLFVFCSLLLPAFQVNQIVFRQTVISIQKYDGGKGRDRCLEGMFQGNPIIDFNCINYLKWHKHVDKRGGRGSFLHRQKQCLQYLVITQHFEGQARILLWRLDEVGQIYFC